MNQDQPSPPTIEKKNSLFEASEFPDHVPSSVGLSLDSCFAPYNSPEQLIHDPRQHFYVVLLC
uniref:Uncharacterized protein n=1 Tax=Physcomitrium patens TaxID=3218 RepID=A0A2K1IH07_PHYPA|nr:hypothetical protein PHYPA_029154 [Physcomitrium patens]